jgi:uncharacterized protein YndB with AHSA1/START domain
VDRACPVAQWWGPTGFSAPAEDIVIEAEIGGGYEIRMVMTDNGGDAWSRGRVIEFEPNRRLAIAWEPSRRPASARPRPVSNSAPTAATHVSS